MTEQAEYCGQSMFKKEDCIKINDELFLRSSAVISKLDEYIAEDKRLYALLEEREQALKKIQVKSVKAKLFKIVGEETYTNPGVVTLSFEISRDQLKDVKVGHTITIVTE